MSFKLQDIIMVNKGPIKISSFGPQRVIIVPWDSRNCQRIQVSAWLVGLVSKFGLPFGSNPISFSFLNLLKIYLDPNITNLILYNFVSRLKP